MLLIIELDTKFMRNGIVLANRAGTSFIRNDNVPAFSKKNKTEQPASRAQVVQLKPAPQPFALGAGFY